jgi:hypothetical protein
MIKLGPTSEEMREMSGDEIFLSRLKLLIIMAKAYLKNCPIGNYRKSAVIENAHRVFYHSLHLACSEPQSGIASDVETGEEEEFHKRVQLLAVMAKAMAENRLTENHRKKALQDNLDRICEILIFSFHLKGFNFLKVA